MKKISKVTVTGADDSVRTDDLVLLAKRFPFVEFGLLVMAGNFGRPRWPSMSWIRDLQRVAEGSRVRLQIAGHICGDWVTEIFHGRFPYSSMPLALLEMAGRWQLNTHGEAHPCELGPFLAMIQDLNQGASGGFWDGRDREVIFQYDGQNTQAVTEAVTAGLKVSALFDMSHGAGILPGAWAPIEDAGGKLLACPWGFAGGLSPENVAHHIERMPVREDGGPIWIDAETRLRSKDDRVFDLAKVEAFLTAAQPWVIGA